MGGGSYSTTSRHTRAVKKAYYTAPLEQTFSSRSINMEMSPKGVMLRESRDSDEHPVSVPIIIALDLTGSMGAVPGHLVRTGLPHIVESVMNEGVDNPQILFLGIGDHETDDSPLQVGQFESSDELLDKWLTSTWLEGGGGGNNGESYLLAWYFAGAKTQHDAMDKRGRKGYLFTIGDEPTLKQIPGRILKNLFGEGQYGNVTIEDALKAASEKYHVYHIHTQETYAGGIESTIRGWKQILKDNVIVVQGHEQIPAIIAGVIQKGENQPKDQVEPKKDQPKDQVEPKKDKPTEHML